MSETVLDKKIARLEAELKNAKATKTKEARKERNGQLMALGILIENQAKLKKIPDELKFWLKEAAESQPDERIKKRCLEAMKRFKEDFKEIEIEKKEDNI
ncbi:MAG: hypothetical protein ACRCSC_05150 [Lactococcus garvieae]